MDYMKAKQSTNTQDILETEQEKKGEWCGKEKQARGHVGKKITC